MRSRAVASAASAVAGSAPDRLPIDAVNERGVGADEVGSSELRLYGVVSSLLPTRRCAEAKRTLGVRLPLVNDGPIRRAKRSDAIAGNPQRPRRREPERVIARRADHPAPPREESHRARIGWAADGAAIDIAADQCRSQRRDRARRQTATPSSTRASSVAPCSRAPCATRSCGGDASAVSSAALV